MFCPGCGSQLPEGAAACGNCGYQFHRGQQTQPAYEQPVQQPTYVPPVQQPAYQQPAYEPPVQQPAYQPQPTYQPPVAPAYESPAAPAYTPEPPAPKRKNGFGKVAGKLVWVTFLITFLLVGLSIYTALNTSLFDLPVVDIAFVVAEDQLEEVFRDEATMELLGDEVEDVEDARDLKKVVKNRFGELEDTYKDVEDDLEHVMDRDEKKTLDTVMDSLGNTVDTMSLLNAHSFVTTVAENAGQLEEMEEAYDVEMDVSDVESLSQLVNIAVILVCMLFVLPLIFTLIAGFCKSKGVTITALVFLVLPQALLCGVLWVVLSLVAFIAQAVLCGIARKASLEEAEA